MASITAPGRLGDPEMSLATEPRIHPKLLAALKGHGIHTLSYLSPDMTPDAPLDTICSFVSKNEEAIERLFENIDYSVPEETSTPITTSEEFVPGPDGNKVRLIIRRPSESLGAPLPAVLYFHGGGMVILRTENAMHTAWAESLARTGLVAITVDFRNALTRTGLNPFPAGLNDCAAAVRWVDAHRERLGISKVVLQGESGGANLALATAIKAKREGWIKAIDGVCASVPYISGAYGLPMEWKLRELPSLVECDGYLISCATSVLNARLYDPSGEHARDPLAWPYWAAEEDMEGLPPHLIVTSELDPLRDEGNAYYRKLVGAGVRAVGKMNMGVIHEAELFLPQTLPDLFHANLWELKKFIDSL
ncbi:alpha/beta-hydrolase [Phialemonium atrogriseum]|uniref:Alpha/beta-hydrolase n=1 Tax=Phialemonium atrogriseum TaxID=1093897 RepID=A0AAJ0FLM0_9PEZI|nr:alpha/beta-hydrolase [Phialemonium atrogriseum]KAK1765240.1 alpha/beta-hydrolase [Phialemonium atrogriseum]